jgi:hypothetical protein
LILAARGYAGVESFEAVRAEDGSFIMRLSRSHDPWVRAAWVNRRLVALRKPVRLSRFVAQNVNRRMDLDVEYERGNGKRLVSFRVIVLPGKEHAMTRLVTTCRARGPPRPRRTALPASVADRARVQGVEVVRKPAQVRHGQRAPRSRPHLGEPLRGRTQAVLAHAAQLVGGKPISTRRVEMGASRVIDDIVTALLACLGLAVAFRDGMAFLLAKARRPRPRRDRTTARLQVRLVVVGERS